MSDHEWRLTGPQIQTANADRPEPLEDPPGVPGTVTTVPAQSALERVLSLSRGEGRRGARRDLALSRLALAEARLCGAATMHVEHVETAARLLGLTATVEGESAPDAVPSPPADIAVASAPDPDTRSASGTAIGGGTVTVATLAGRRRRPSKRRPFRCPPETPTPRIRRPPSMTSSRFVYRRRARIHDRQPAA